MAKLLDAITDVREFSHETQRLLSLGFLAIAGAMSFQEYVHVGWLWDRHLSFEPDFLSSVLAVLLMAPLYLRGILKWNRSPYSIISFLLLLLVFASFVELALGGSNQNSVITSMLAASIVLSWLGITGVASVSWVSTAGAAIYSTHVNNLALDIYGFLYIAAACLGLLFHSGLNLGQLVAGMKEAYQGQP